MRRRRLPPLPALAAVLALAVAFLLNRAPDGSTRESREALLHDVPEGIRWTIASELELEHTLVSAVTAPGQDGLAFFEPRGGRAYRWMAVEHQEAGVPITTTWRDGDTYFNVFWCSRPDLDYAEVAYRLDGRELPPVRLDASDLSILVHEPPGNSYSLRVVYYDVHGNAYK